MIEYFLMVNGERERGDSPKKRLILKSPSDTVELRQFLPEDAKTLHKLIRSNKKRLTRSLSGFVQRTQTVSDVRLMIEASLEVISQEAIFGIWDGDSLVGSQTLLFHDGITGETVSWVDKRFTGNDYAFRGRALLIDFAFNMLGMRYLESNILGVNPASVRSVEKSGFVYDSGTSGLSCFILRNPNPHLPKNGKI